VSLSEFTVDHHATRTREWSAVWGFSYREFLKEVADAGTLIFATTDVGTAHEEHPLWLSVDIDGGALRQTINIDW